MKNLKDSTLIAIIIAATIIILSLGGVLIYMLVHSGNDDSKEAVSAPSASAEATETPVPLTPASQNRSDKTDDGGADETAKYTVYVVNCEEWISLRSQPSTSADRLAKIPLGNSCGFIEKSSNGFSKVSYNGITGYALDKYLSTEKPNIVQAPSSEILYVANCKESITLRPSDNVNSGEIMQIPLGAAVEYLGTAGNGFYKVRYNGKTGYALSQYLSKSKNTAPSTPKMTVVNCKESITLRPSDNVDSGEIMQIPLGASVEYLGTAGNGFYRVRYNGAEGYALSQYLN